MNNSATKLGRALCVSIAVLVTAMLAVATVYVHEHVDDKMVIGYWWFGNIALLFCVIAFVKGRRFTHLPVALGRTVAIVPAFEEDEETLRACIWSILNQTVSPDEIHVVDDGSVDKPVRPFVHPRVTWHRKENGGKRLAQGYVLERLNPDDWDFILTVDGDSVLDPKAMEHMLRAFSNPKVMAATGMVLVRNMRHNLLTRIADMNIGTSCVMMRASRSLLGTLETTSGALAVYRAPILFKHRERYVSSGTYGDDRALAMYSALEGEVVGVNEALVWSDMPTDRKTTYKQRLRWSKSWWCMIPFVLTNMDKFRQMFFPLFGMVQLVVAPLTIGYMVFAISFNAFHGIVHWTSILMYGCVYFGIRYGETALYMVERPGMPRKERVLMWLFITPLEAFVNLLFLNPTKYIALIKLRDHGWGTRGNAHSRKRGAHKQGKGGRHRAGMAPLTPTLPIPVQRHEDTIPLKKLYDPETTITTELPLPVNLRGVPEN